jgi:glyoxylase-like metal-dependent hydrolase (beta-lactamase superfamily II)
MLFRQLFEPESCTYTYLIGCEETRKAILVDPVLETFERDLDLLTRLDLTLNGTLETHVHADHLTGALKLRALVGSRILAPSGAGVDCADLQVNEEAPVVVGTVSLKPLFTPGHTDHHLSYLVAGDGWQAVMTGDCLLIDGCGRTDFQGGDTATLYRSVNDVLFALPDDTLVYPGHDYKGRRVSSIGQEKTRNPRLGAGKELAAFAEIMDNLDLAYPKKIDLAVPANRACGECPDDVPDTMKRLCEIDEQG